MSGSLKRSLRPAAPVERGKEMGMRRRLVRGRRSKGEWRMRDINSWNTTVMRQEDDDKL